MVDYAYPETPNGGLMLIILENNRFEGVRRGLVISSPLNWPLFRNNRIQLIEPGRREIVDEGLEVGRTPARDILVLQDAGSLKTSKSLKKRNGEADR